MTKGIDTESDLASQDQRSPSSEGNKEANSGSRDQRFPSAKIKISLGFWALVISSISAIGTFVGPYTKTGLQSLIVSSVVLIASIAGVVIYRMLRDGGDVRIPARTVAIGVILLVAIGVAAGFFGRVLREEKADHRGTPQPGVTTLQPSQQAKTAGPSEPAPSLRPAVPGGVSSPVSPAPTVSSSPPSPSTTPSTGRPPAEKSCYDELLLQSGHRVDIRGCAESSSGQLELDADGGVIYSSDVTAVEAGKGGTNTTVVGCKNNLQYKPILPDPIPADSAACLRFKEGKSYTEGGPVAYVQVGKKDSSGTVSLRIFYWFDGRPM